MANERELTVYQRIIRASKRRVGLCLNCGHATPHNVQRDWDVVVCDWHRPDAGGDGYYCHCCIPDFGEVPP